MTYNTPNISKMISEKKPDSKKMPKKDDPKDKSDDSTPTVKIVITQAPDGSLSTDDGKEATQHSGVDDLLSHLSGRLNDTPADDEDDEAPPSTGPAGPSSSAASSGPMSALVGQ